MRSRRESLSSSDNTSIYARHVPIRKSGNWVGIDESRRQGSISDG